MKKILFILLIFNIFFAGNSVLAENAAQSNVQVKKVVASDFSKSYKISSENLLYLLLSAINEHNYSIEEIQFRTGSVLFKAYTKEFVASVSAKDGYNSFMKIIPADNNYNFSPSLLQKLHTYIENNNSISFQKIL